MKLLIISYHYLPDISAGSFRVNSLLKEGTIVKEKDDQLELICSTPNRNHLAFSKEKEDFLPFKITRLSVPNLGNSQLSEVIKFIIFSIKAIFICFNRRPDIIFATSSKLMTAVLAAFISKIKSVKLYIDIRDIFVESLEDTASKLSLFILLPSIKLLEKFSINRATKINLVSLGFKDYFEKKYPHKHFSYFTNGIDIEYLDKLSLKKKLNENYSGIEKKINVLYAGNIGVGQSLEKILPELALKFEKKAEFTIIGSGAKKNILSHLISKNEIKNIKLLDPIERNELFKLYSQADILFLHLDNKMAFERVLPSKIFEYASTGLPIVAGVGGYAKKFLLEEVENVSVFQPSNVQSAISSLNAIDLKIVDRQDFILRYSRKKISHDLFKDILSIN